MSFSEMIRNEVLSWAGVSEKPHHVLPESGWISYYLKSEEDIPFAIELFRMQYDRIKK
ncbi:DUF5519 family protein [Bacillus cereus]|uniref:luciferase domain-containing protein n=1 Tax=Bacillus TaxID=1386 RepID=UPI001FF2D7A4|nr:MULTISPECIES: luciferase family protein [Bacillus]MDA2451194.1 DUF5519 family protein [Bacillus cereus]MDA2457090.1 DUF5519 family protein [Bacillus cereus]MDK3014812.1 DUF5519 family protein [Bacillus sp. RB3]MDZ4439000.1 DUF5519 family protein [Bacillus cereus]UOX98215.1 DUF5519 family protein [Bacillus cereus]